MTARTIGDCEACKDALTELVCDELDDATREAVLAHTQGCTSCASELVKLRAVMQVAESLPLEAPSPRVRSAVMLAAREASARRAALPQAPARATESKLEILRTWLTQLGTWAMSPQVAMASVLLLMLGVGLVALPLGQDREQAALRAAEEAHEAPSPTASGTAIVPPSAPPAEESARDQDLAEREQADDTKNVYAAEKAVEAKPSAQRRDAARAASKAFASKKESPLDALMVEEGAKKRERIAPLGNVSPSGGSSAPAAQEVQEAFPDMATSKAARSGGAVKGAESDFAPAPPPKPSAAAPSPAAEPSIAAESAGYAARDEAAPETQLLAQGVSAARNGDYTGAIGLLRPLASKGSATVRREASLWLARSYRALDKCGEALRYYAPLVEATNASQALIAEAIDCYDRTGATKQAAALRSRITPSKAKKGVAEEPAAAPKD